jgi:hypothetical protein
MKNLGWLSLGLLTLICLTLFLSTSVEVSTAETFSRTVEIGFWDPWYTQIEAYPNYSYEINMLTQSFLCGLIATTILGWSLYDVVIKSRKANVGR